MKNAVAAQHIEQFDAFRVKRLGKRSECGGKRFAQHD